MWRVIPEPVVVQPCFPIFVLSLETERYEVSFSSEFQYIPIDVEDTVPNHLTIAVEGLYGRAHIVLHDTVAVLLGEFCHRGVTTTVIHPCNEIGVRFLSIITDTPQFILLCPRLFPPVITPLVQQHVAVPGIAIACVVRLFKGTPAQGIVLKPYDGTIGRAYALEHAIAVPLVSGISLLPAIMSLQFLVIGRGSREEIVKPILGLRHHGRLQDIARALEDKIAFPVVAIVVLLILEQPAAPVIYTSPSIPVPIDVADDVGSLEETLAHVKRCTDEGAEAVIVVHYGRLPQVRPHGKQPVVPSPCIEAVSARFRPRIGTPCLQTPRKVVFRGNAHATRGKALYLASPLIVADTAFPSV